MSTAMTTAPALDVKAEMALVENPRATFDQRISGVQRLLTALAPKMFAALPKVITPERMIRVVINAIRKNPKILECDAASLFGSIADAATYGWEIGGTLAEAHLVPFSRGKNKPKECVLIPGYRGLISLARRSGQVSTVTMEVVHEGDKFSYRQGDGAKIEHVPNEKDPKRHEKPITHVYAVVELRDGGVQRSVWPTNKIEGHKEQYSKAWDFAERGNKEWGGSKKDSAWHTAWPVMAKKTVIRDMIMRGLVPVSAEQREFITKSAHVEDEAFDVRDFMNAMQDTPALPEPDAQQIEHDQDATDRPESTPEIDPDLTDSVRIRLDDCDSPDLVEQVQNDWLPKCNSEAERTAVLGLCEARRKALGGKGKAKQKELV